MPMTPEERKAKRLEYQRAWAKEHTRQNRNQAVSTVSRSHNKDTGKLAGPPIEEVRYMPVSFTPPADKSKDGPTVTKYPIRLEQIDLHRSYDCASYDRCLDLVAGTRIGSGLHEPGGFSCRPCKWSQVPGGRPKDEGERVQKNQHVLELEDEELEEETQEDGLALSGLDGTIPSHEVFESAFEPGIGNATGESKGGDIREPLGVGEEVSGELAGVGEGAGDDAGPASCYPTPSPGDTSCSLTDFSYSTNSTRSEVVG